MNTLIAAQVAFCFVVYFVTGLFVRTFDRLANQPTGFASDRLLAVETVTRNSQSSVHWDAIERHLKSVHGVESAALGQWALMCGSEWSDSVWINGNPPDADFPYFLRISPGWLGTMRIPLLDGRDFRPEEVFPGAAIVNEAFARRYFEGRNPLGHSFETDVNGKRLQSRIIGYVRDARYANMREPLGPRSTRRSTINRRGSIGRPSWSAPPAPIPCYSRRSSAGK